ncbi:MAG: hypothetical protein WAU10_24685 [Caldilineaceae bacterium]
MAEILRIFVSATNDLEAERAVIGQVLAELPVQIRAEIRRSPITGISYDNLFELVANVDRFYFLMGRDITAPAGAEWQLAMQLERSILPLRLAGSRTSAGQEFLHYWPLRWKIFHHRNQLARMIGLDLVEILLHPTNRYGLSVTEVAALHVHKKKLAEGQVADMEEADSAEGGGAEGGGVLLDATQRDRIDTETLTV